MSGFDFPSSFPHNRDDEDSPPSNFQHTIGHSDGSSKRTSNRAKPTKLSVAPLDDDDGSIEGHEEDADSFRSTRFDPFTDQSFLQQPAPSHSYNISNEDDHPHLPSAHDGSTSSEEWTDEDEEFKTAASQPRHIQQPSTASVAAARLAQGISGMSSGFYGLASASASASSYPPSSGSPSGGDAPGGSLPASGLMTHPSFQSLVNGARVSLDYSRMAYDNAAELTRRGGAAFMEDVVPVLVAAASVTASTSAEAIAIGVPRVSQAITAAQAHLQASTLPACVQQAKIVQRWLAARVHLTLPPAIPSTIAHAQNEKEELGGYIEYIERALKAQEDADEARLAAARARHVDPSPGSATPVTPATPSTTYLSGQPVVVIDDHFSVLTHKEKKKLEDFLSDWKRVRSQAVLHEGNDRVTAELKERFRMGESNTIQSEGGGGEHTNTMMHTETMQTMKLEQESPQPMVQTIHAQSEQSGEVTSFSGGVGGSVPNSFLSSSSGGSMPTQFQSFPAGGFYPIAAATASTPTHSQIFESASNPPSSMPPHQFSSAPPVANPMPSMGAHPAHLPHPFAIPHATARQHSTPAADPHAAFHTTGFQMQPRQQPPPQQQQPHSFASLPADPFSQSTHSSFLPVHPFGQAPVPADLSKSPPATHAINNFVMPVSLFDLFPNPTLDSHPSHGGDDEAGMSGIASFGHAPMSPIHGGPFDDARYRRAPSAEANSTLDLLGAIQSTHSVDASLSSSLADSGIGFLIGERASRSASTTSVPLDSPSPKSNVRTPNDEDNTNTQGHDDEITAEPTMPTTEETNQPTSETNNSPVVESPAPLLTETTNATAADPVPMPADSTIPIAPPLDSVCSIPVAPPMAPPLAPPLFGSDVPPPPPGGPGCPGVAAPSASSDPPLALKHPKPTVPLKHVHWHKLKHHDVQGTVFEEILEPQVILQTNEMTNLPPDNHPSAGTFLSVSPLASSSTNPLSPLVHSATPLLMPPGAVGVGMSTLPQTLSSIDIDLNVQDLEQKFYSGPRKRDAKSTNTKEGKAGGQGRKKDENAAGTLELPSGIDVLRAQNAEISLSRLKMQPHEIRDHLWLRVTRPPTPTPSASSSSSVPPSESSPSNPLVHSSDALEILSKICPTDEESLIIQKTNRTESQLTKVHCVETLFRTLIQVPRVKRRVELLLFRLESQSTVRYLSESITLIEQAAEELKESQSLRYILKLILTIGNTLNHATSNLGQAWGFRLKFLTSIHATKASDGTMSLMHFVIQSIEQHRNKFLANAAAAPAYEVGGNSPEDDDANGDGCSAEYGDLHASIVSEGPLTASAAPPEVLQLLTELKHVESAAAVDSAALSAALQGMKSKLGAIASEIKLVSSKNASIDPLRPDAIEPDGFAAFMTDFLEQMQAQYEELQARFDAAVRTCDQLARYFAETDPLKLESLFGIFRDFLDAYRSAEAELTRKAKLEREKNARIANHAARQTKTNLQTKTSETNNGNDAANADTTVMPITPTADSTPIPSVADGSSSSGASDFSAFNAVELSAAIAAAISCSSAKEETVPAAALTPNQTHIDHEPTSQQTEDAPPKEDEPAEESQQPTLTPIEHPTPLTMPLQTRMSTEPIPSSIPLDSDVPLLSSASLSSSSSSSSLDSVSVSAPLSAASHSASTPLMSTNLRSSTLALTLSNSIGTMRTRRKTSKITIKSLPDNEID